MEETILEEQTYTPARWMTAGAKFLSLVLTPMIIPFLAFVVFLFGTPLRFPLRYIPYVQFMLLGIVFCFTILLPAVTIFLYKMMHRFSWNDLLERRTRFVPYAITIISYGFCLVLIHRIAQYLRYGYFMTGIILSVLICLTICFLINIKWKISVHMAGIGGATGMLVAISPYFLYNPVFALCGMLLLSGCLGSSRIILGRHTFYEVISGYTLGLVCALLILRYEILSVCMFYLEKLF